MAALTALFFLWSACGAAWAEEPPLLVNRDLPGTYRKNSDGSAYVAYPEDMAYADFTFPEGAELLRVVFPTIRDCDAALLLCGGEAMLIDCGSEFFGTMVVDLLRDMQITRLKYVVNTHPHNDHLLGLEKVAEQTEIGELLVCFPENATAHMQIALEVAKERNIPVRWYGDGERLTLGGATLDVWLKGDEDWTLNEASAQIRLAYGARTMLFTADMQRKTQRRLLEVIPAELLDCDILKYPHHGLEKPDDAFFAAVSPVFAVITNMNTDRTRGVREYLTKQGVPFALTIPGYVSLTTDGATWLAERLVPLTPPH